MVGLGADQVAHGVLIAVILDVHDCLANKTQMPRERTGEDSMRRRSGMVWLANLEELELIGSCGA